MSIHHCRANALSWISILAANTHISIVNTGNTKSDFPIFRAAGLDNLTCIYHWHERLNKEFWSSAIERGQMVTISIRACYQTQHMVPNLSVIYNWHSLPRCIQTYQESPQGWHGASDSPFPVINYILQKAYSWKVLTKIHRMQFTLASSIVCVLIWPSLPCVPLWCCIWTLCLWLCLSLVY